jgi:predicted glycosyltransferase
MVYTGYLRREVGEAAAANIDTRGLADGEFLLVTAGGGGDGEELIDWVLAAYENDPGALPPALIVFGPFMVPERQATYDARAARLSKVRAITFDAHLEALMARAKAVVAMGGYNTFCEILSFDKPALILPRMVPRLEQYIRARRAAELGLVSILSDENARDPVEMAAALLQLTQQAPPSAVVVPGLLDGMPNVNKLARKWLDRGRHPRFGSPRFGSPVRRNA